MRSLQLSLIERQLLIKATRILQDTFLIDMLEKYSAANMEEGIPKFDVALIVKHSNQLWRLEGKLQDLTKEKCKCGKCQ